MNIPGTVTHRITLACARVMLSVNKGINITIIPARRQQYRCDTLRNPHKKPAVNHQQGDGKAG
ncbi:unknown protein [Cronobacter turicensis z3032]|uniref:Uncharacterized protein n=1 Tax=Cronobacter turicensis (strain DSM 18703 / CCUG 55852 / LMG 23827 / z3032) TaxID=693216 RepID=C9XVQ4_CROTZ|nr:unknown protein [Cronobacter turicensis z3032]